jgi:hypothetical protein
VPKHEWASVLLHNLLEMWPGFCLATWGVILNALKGWPPWGVINALGWLLRNLLGAHGRDLRCIEGLVARVILKIELVASQPTSGARLPMHAWSS